MRRRCLHLLALACLVLGQRPCALAQEKTAAEGAKGIEAQLKDAMMENIKSTEAEDVDGTMKTIHSKSPLYQATRKQVSQIFGKHLGLKYELISPSTSPPTVTMRLPGSSSGRLSPPSQHQEQRKRHDGRLPQGRRHLEILEPSTPRVQVPETLIVTQLMP